MNRLKYISAAVALLAMLPGLLSAQELMIYPAKGQSSQQQEKDKFECYGFAKSQSGFDPMAPPTTTTAPPPKEAPQGGVGRGAVGGALGGALVGAITGNTKKGAAVGAVGGGLLGGARRSEQKQRETHKQQQWEQREVQNYAQNRNNYNRAYAACLEGRGYTVR
ncbi:MAG TPA: hypothetical protein ENK49_06165 [Gammaproteobacteria bacterium]|nr:hypothetical protein [Gammaproteobacteria bacterium]